MFCTKCGMANDDSNRACVHCGTSLERAPEVPLPPVKPVNRFFYLVSVGVSGVTGLVLVLASVLNLQGESPSFLAVLPLLLGELFIMYLAGVMVALWYFAWRAVQDGHARTSPGRAVGLLFVPFFNFYWMFEAYWGWAKDYNALLERHRLELPRQPAWLFLLLCILTAASLPMAFVPVARFVFPVISLGALFGVVHHVTRGVNELARRSRH